MHVAILLTTYNGARFLPLQLKSFAQQTHADWHVWVSDDGSSDETLAIIAEFAKTHPVTVLEGPRLGFAVNFISLYKNPSIDADVICFCDQDDIWMPEKLARSVAACERQSPGTPVLYCSMASYIDEENHFLGNSTRFTKSPTFANALVQCIAGGNTMALSRPAHQLLQQTQDVTIISHDWWAYQLITGAGGVVCYDAAPMVEYRQHRGNIAGSNRGIQNSMNRLRRLMVGQFTHWNDVQCAALQANRMLLTHDNQRRLDLFCRARAQSLITRLRSLHAAGVYRQTWLGNIGLITAAVLKRI